MIESCFFCVFPHSRSLRPPGARRAAAAAVGGAAGTKPSDGEVRTRQTRGAVLLRKEQVVSVRVCVCARQDPIHSGERAAGGGGAGEGVRGCGRGFPEDCRHAGAEARPDRDPAGQ